MVVTPSSMTELDADIVDFNLVDTRNQVMVNLHACRQSKPTLIAFICNHCPYVVHIIERLAAVANDYQERGGAVFFISSNDVEHYPDDAPELMQALARDYAFQFPYLFDETQSVARAYKAECTPDFFLYGGAGHLIYRGRFDAATPGNTHPVTGEDLVQALDSTLLGEPVRVPQLPSYGCNIKWK
jgi:peroxiredoxin